MIGFYKNGNYTVTMLPDGTKIRKTEEDEFIPAFAENCDVKITDKCDGGCNFCFENCTLNGKHADFSKYEKLFDSLHPYTELALNGNDLSHPDLENLLNILKEKRIFTNMTVNQKHFEKYYDKLLAWEKSGLIHGLGVSLVNPTEEFIAKVQDFPNTVIHVINGIWTAAEREVMKNKGLKVLILGYKVLNRGEIYYCKNLSDIRLKMHCLYNDMEKIINEGWFNVVSFDNLAIEQLEVKRIIPENEWEEFYMGDDGRYTFYIDLVNGKFSKNSIAPLEERYDIGDKTIDEMFKIIRK